MSQRVVGRTYYCFFFNVFFFVLCVCVLLNGLVNLEFMYAAKDQCCPRPWAEKLPSSVVSGQCGDSQLVKVLRISDRWECSPEWDDCITALTVFRSTVGEEVKGPWELEGGKRAVKCYLPETPCSMHLSTHSGCVYRCKTCSFKPLHSPAWTRGGIMRSPASLRNYWPLPCYKVGSWFFPGDVASEIPTSHAHSSEPNETQWFKRKKRHKWRGRTCGETL